MSTEARNQERRKRMTVKVAAGEVTQEYADWFIDSCENPDAGDPAVEDARIARAEGTDRSLIRPTTIGQVVRAASYGGSVRRWMTEPDATGIVRRFTRSGNPVVNVTAPGYLPTEVVDTQGNFRLWDVQEGRWFW